MRCRAARFWLSCPYAEMGVPAGRGKRPAGSLAPWLIPPTPIPPQSNIHPAAGKVAGPQRHSGQGRGGSSWPGRAEGTRGTRGGWNLILISFQKCKILQADFSPRRTVMRGSSLILDSVWLKHCQGGRPDRVARVAAAEVETGAGSGARWNVACTRQSPRRCTAAERWCHHEAPKGQAAPGREPPAQQDERQARNPPPEPALINFTPKNTGVGEGRLFELGQTPAWLSMVWHCTAWPSMAQHGTTWLSVTQHVPAWPTWYSLGWKSSSLSAAYATAPANCRPGWKMRGGVGWRVGGVGGGGI